MKTVPLMILALTAAPAFAGDFPIFLGHRDPEYRGVVDRWPGVRRARDIERLCLTQQLAIYEQDKRALDAATPSMYRPSYTPMTTTAPAPAPTTPAPAPPRPPTAAIDPSPTNPSSPRPGDDLPRVKAAPGASYRDRPPRSIRTDRSCFSLTGSSALRYSVLRSSNPESEVRAWATGRRNCAKGWSSWPCWPGSRGGRRTGTGSSRGSRGLDGLAADGEHGLSRAHAAGARGGAGDPHRGGAERPRRGDIIGLTE